MPKGDLENIKSSVSLVEYALKEYESHLINFACTILHDRERSKDVVQDTFIKLYKQDVEKVKANLKSWLFTVCKNRALDVLRKEKRLITLEDETLSTIGEDNSEAEQIALTEEKVASIFRLLTKLPENQRICIELKFKHGLSYLEISEKTGLKTGNIGFIIHAGIKKLKELIPKNLDI